MAHAQKTDFVFRRNGRVHLNLRGASVQSNTGSRGVRISGSNAGYTMFRGSAKSTGYPLHSPVSPSLLHPCVTVCHRISTGFYRVSFPGVKRPECGVDHHLHLAPRLKKEKNYACTSLWTFMAFSGVHFYLYAPLKPVNTRDSFNVRRTVGGPNASLYLEQPPAFSHTSGSRRLDGLFKKRITDPL